MNRGLGDRALADIIARRLPPTERAAANQILIKIITTPAESHLLTLLSPSPSDVRKAVDRINRNVSAMPILHRDSLLAAGAIRELGVPLSGLTQLSIRRDFQWRLSLINDSPELESKLQAARAQGINLDPAAMTLAAGQFRPETMAYAAALLSHPDSAQERELIESVCSGISSDQVWDTPTAVKALEALHEYGDPKAVNRAIRHVIHGLDAGMSGRLTPSNFLLIALLRKLPSEDRSRMLQELASMLPTANPLLVGAIAAAAAEFRERIEPAIWLNAAKHPLCAGDPLLNIVNALSIAAGRNFDGKTWRMVTWADKRYDVGGLPSHQAILRKQSP
jgi:hypothetical protein